ncbi:MAG: tetratricopeptide repeat protein [Bdellovibrio sp.]|nr:tetratricopeptide repeat protein [Bdellovibrio sp.]
MKKQACKVKKCIVVKWPTTSLILTFLCITLFACGHHSIQGTQEDQEVAGNQKSDSKLNQEIEKIYQNASKRLDVLVAESKKAGGPGIQFLSTDLFLKANDSSIRGDARTAAFLFKYVMELNPEDAYIQKKYAIEMIRLGELVEAKDVLEKLFARPKQEDENVGLILGGVYTTMENDPQAQQTYKKLMTMFPKSEEACVFLAKSYATAKKFDDANRLLDSCQKNSKGKAIFAYYRGKIALVQEKREAAAKNFRIAIQIDKTYYQAAMGLGLLREEKEDYKGAAAIYEKFIKENPDNYTVLSRLVQVMFAGEMFDKVLPYAEKLAGIDPSDLNLKIRLGILYTDVKRYSDAKELFKQVLESVPENDKIIYYLGALYQQTGEFEDAVTYYSKVPNSSSLFLDSNLQIATILQVRAQEDHLNNSEEGLQVLLEFVKKQASAYPELKTELYVNLAGHYEGMGQTEEAIKWLELVVTSEKFGDQQRYFLASLYEKVADYDKSQKIVEEILKRDPQNAHALNFVGYSLLDRGVEMDKALDYIVQAVKLRPDDGYILDSLGWYYFKVGDFKKALTHIEKAWNLQKDDVVITKHLAQVYLKMQRLKEAKKYFVEALKNCKVESERSEVLEAMEEMEEVRLPASVQSE